MIDRLFFAAFAVSLIWAVVLFDRYEGDGLIGGCVFAFSGVLPALIAVAWAVFG